MGRGGEPRAFRNGNAAASILAGYGAVEDTSADQQVISPSASNPAKFMGVAQEDIVFGAVGTFQRDGEAKVVVCEAVTRGDHSYLKGTLGKFASIEANVTGTAQIWHCTGQFEQAATADNDIVDMIVACPAFDYEA